MSMFDETIGNMQGKIEDLEALVNEQKDRIASLEEEIERLSTEGGEIIAQIKDIIKYHDKF